jgi:alkylated DNA nucleotide flippase Atl1
LAEAYGELGLPDAWRCIGEAITVMETTKATIWEARVYRAAGDIALMSPQPGAAKAEAYLERALAVARQQQAQIPGTPRSHEPRPPLARPGQKAASARTADAGL